MKTAVVALSLALLLLASCASQRAMTPAQPSPIAQPPIVQPVTQPAEPATSGVAEVDSFEQDLSELDQLEADLKELEAT